MKNENYDIDELLECAVREKGAIDRMKMLDVRSAARRRIWLKGISWCTAACLILCCGAGLKLRFDAKDAGYSVNPTEFCRGSSEITALMQEDRTDEAMALIDGRLTEIDESAISAEYEDSDYALQLKADIEELEYLKAVCLLRDGRWFKARKALKAISEAGGIYTAQATELLEML